MSPAPHHSGPDRQIEAPLSPARPPAAKVDVVAGRRRKSCKASCFVGDRKLELREFPDPTPGPREVVLEIKASGMCGSDLHTYRAPFAPGEVTGGIKRGW